MGLEGPEDPEDPEQQEVTVRRSGRTRTPTVRYQAYSATTDIIIPKPYAEAIADPINKADWERAISEELTKLQALNTWKTETTPWKEGRRL